MVISGVGVSTSSYMPVIPSNTAYAVPRSHKTHCQLWSKDYCCHPLCLAEVTAVSRLRDDELREERCWKSAPWKRRFIFRLLYLQGHFHEPHFHNNSFLVGLKLALFNGDEAKMLFFCVTQIIISLEPASTSCRAVVLAHSCIGLY